MTQNFIFFVAYYCRSVLYFRQETPSTETGITYRRSKIQSLKKMLSQPSTTKLISSLSSKRAIIAQVIDFILHVVYKRPKKERRKNWSRLNFCRQMNNHYI